MRRLAALIALFVTTACGPPRPGTPPTNDDVTVFAAASLTGVLTRLSRDYTQKTGVPVRINFAASSTLARQLQAGARADVYISADPVWMDSLEKDGLIEAGSRRDLVSNALVLIAPSEAVFEATLTRDFPIGDAFRGRLAIGDPAHVPAGRYARQSLEAIGWWDAVEDRVLPAADVRDALRLVSMNAVGAGVVYATDAASSDRVEVVGVFPGETHDPILYPSALVIGASPAARGFLDSLFGADAIEVFEAAEFVAAVPG